MTVFPLPGFAVARYVVMLQAEAGRKGRMMRAPDQVIQYYSGEAELM